MEHTWASDKWAAIALRAPPWRATLIDGTLQVSIEGVRLAVPIGNLRLLRLTKGLIWSDVEVDTSLGRNISLSAIKNGAAHEMQAIINARILAWWGTAFDSACAKIDEWVKQIYVAASVDRWISNEEATELSESRPKDPDLGMDIAAYLRTPQGHAAEIALPDARRRSLALWTSELLRFIAARNERWLDGEIQRSRDFLNRVEKSPLTDEQATAVTCFENRVLVVAAAGSGKTATMVARAGYALHRKLVEPEQILLLAFNKDAALELQQRVADRLPPLGLPAERVTAKTFHAFGLQVIGHATGKKPRVAPWLDNGNDVEAMSDLIDELRDADTRFRLRWDLFRFVFDEDLEGFGEDNEHEDWDPASRRTGFRTHRGEVVKSREERTLANWYFLNGVEYEYEASYEHDVADPTHSQYRPDFYLPAARAYHEHFALDAAGQPPAKFEGYLAGVKWKKRTHQEHGTTLLVTTSASVRSGEAFEYLAAKLEARGVTLDPNPDRPVPGKPPISHRDLSSLFRTFLIHAKSNRLSSSELRSRLQAEPTGVFRFRHRLFLDLYERIAAAWNQKLADAGEVDFEDMLNAAADHLEVGRYRSPYRLVMVDEFQDASQARARLVRALVDKPGRFLFAVGDDWQSINRFAGADISIMTRFHQEFGHGRTLKLGRTFRCPQTLCDISSSFVSKNPMQIQKRVVSQEPEQPPVVRILSVPDRHSFEQAVEDRLEGLVAKLRGQTAHNEQGGIGSILLLGRYRANRPARLAHWQKRFKEAKSIEFMTIHGSKGLEADHVLVLQMTQRGFPSFKEDDPLLALAMPEKERFKFSEERRLFYVALTRARQSVTIFTQDGRQSEFLVEITRENSIVVERMHGGSDNSEPCPKCGRGRMILKDGRRGLFYGCSAFPGCKHSRDYAGQGC